MVAFQGPVYRWALFTGQVAQGAHSHQPLVGPSAKFSPLKRPITSGQASEPTVGGGLSAHCSAAAGTIAA